MLPDRDWGEEEEEEEGCAHCVPTLTFFIVKFMSPEQKSLLSGPHPRHMTLFQRWTNWLSFSAADDPQELRDMVLLWRKKERQRQSCEKKAESPQKGRGASKAEVAQVPEGALPSHAGLPCFRSRLAWTPGLAERS